MVLEIKYNYYFILFTLIFIVGCETDECSTEEVIPEHIHLTLVDNLGNSLIGTKYSADTIEILNADLPIELTAGQQTIRFHYQYIASGTEVLLHLDSLNSDTLSISYLRQETTCGFEYPITKLSYNSNSITLNEQNDYLITK